MAAKRAKIKREWKIRGLWRKLYKLLNPLDVFLEFLFPVFIDFITSLF